MEIHVRFPNESTYIKINNFNSKEFKMEKVFDECAFGWWGDTYVAILADDYNKLL